MAGPARAPDVVFDAEMLGQLMPMYLHLNPEGLIRSVGPTMARLLNPVAPVGRQFLDLFALRRPRAVQTITTLAAHTGQRLHLQLRRPPGTSFRGQALMLNPTQDGQGGADPAAGCAGDLFVNLSFGLTVSSAVRAHGLTERAFAPTDLTIEMLYLTEAKTAVMRELHSLNSRLNAAKTEAEDQALTDPLTGLRNRRALELQIRSALTERLPFGLMQIDLDRFKAVNDTLGHAAGDAVLCHVADVLVRETREIDTVARIGGDEFVVIFPRLTGVSLLRRIAERILDRVRQPIAFQGQPCQVSASIGLTTCVGGDDRVLNDQSLLQHVDKALYASKDSGRGCVTVVNADG